jgi:hypothetical protein
VREVDHGLHDGAVLQVGLEPGDEGAVDLDLGDRERAQLGQAAPPGAEVVDADGHAARCQRVHGVGHREASPARAGLGDLEDDLRGVDGVLAQQRQHLGHEARRLEVARRDVDRDRSTAGRPPSRQQVGSACRRTQFVNGAIRSDCSTPGRKAAGPSSPRSGCCHRTSASTPTVRPVPSAILRW